METSTKSTSSSGGLSPAIKIAIAVALVIGILAYILSIPKEEDKIPAGYYMGPRYNNNTGKFVDGHGKIVPSPPGFVVPKAQGSKNNAIAQ